MGTITDKLNKLAETKSAIKTAIVNKGVAVSDSDTFASYASKIASISGGGTPTEGIYGVFIYDTNGNLTKPEEWDTANNDLAVGVAVIDENCSFIIGKTDISGISWSNTLYGTTVSGVTTTTNYTAAKTDYAGEANSSIVRDLTSGETNIFNRAYSKTITVNGTTLYGYIGALGEWVTANNNSSAINSALSKIGGSSMMEGGNFWTSTQYSSNNAWRLRWSYYDSIHTDSKNKAGFARAFFHLDYPSNNTTPYKYKIVYKSAQPITTGDFDILISLGDRSYPRFENIVYNAKDKYLSDLWTTLKTENRYLNSIAPVGSITINAENCSQISYLFGGNYIKYFVDDLNIHINTSDKLTDLSNLLYYCKYTGNLTISNTSKVTNFSYAFSYYSNPELKELDTSSCNNFNYILSDSDKTLIKIAGLSLKSLNVNYISYNYFTGSSTMPNLRYVLLKDFGTGSSFTSASFTYWKVWGIEDETVPLSAGARQSLIDTLITYSYDRATAGYSTCTVELSADTKALLTEDEIAQITAKGYTLA